MRADLRRYYGISLTQMFSGEVSPDEVWDMITHLPRTSATTAARLDDPETVFSGEESEPPWQEWSPEAQRLDDLYDVLALISDQIAKFGSKKRAKVTPRKRPGGELRKRLKAQRSAQMWAEWNELLGRLGVPH